jgi:predicted dehydrogenase
VFTVIGAIALQGIRLVAPTLGETVIVVGLGLVGLIAVQLLKANGCKVIGVDTDPSKVKLAETFGVFGVCPSADVDPVAFAMNKTSGVGADGVLITASTNSNEVISQAAKMSRRRGRIVLVGVVGLDLSRADFYEKELTFQVSCSYGPGRYDDDYELKSRDYPVGFVRWTEQRNFEAVLEVIVRGQLKLQSLITAVTPITKYQDVYDNISDPSKIASILAYSSDGKAVESKSIVVNARKKSKIGQPVVAVIGAGNYTTSMIIPILKSLDVGIKTIVSAGGLSAMTAAKKAEAVIASTDFEGVLKDSEIDVVIIATRHNLHADMVVQCLDAGKHVFVEKPLCLTTNELSNIFSAYQITETSTLTVGFNRRFSPFAMEMRQRIGDTQANIVITINAGSIPSDLWVHDLEIGGGRIVGEGCHFIDLCSYLANSRVIAVCMSSMGLDTDRTSDNASILLNLENGSQATINYFSNGHRGYAKERIEVFSGGRTMVMNNWRTLKGFGFDRSLKQSKRQDKGHRSQFGSLIENLAKGGDPLIPFNEIYNVSEASIACLQSLSERRWVDLMPLS